MLASAAVVLIAAPALALQPVQGSPPSDSSRQVIIRTTDDGGVAAINQRYGTRVISCIPSQNLFLLQLPAQANEALVLSSLEGEERVAWAEMNFAHTAPNGTTQSFFVSSIAPAYDQQYASDLLDLDAAHGLASGTGVTVAVLDTGVWPHHSLLAGRVLTAAGANFITPGAPPDDSGNGLDDDGDGFVDEFAGHGTFVAGLIVTVAPQAQIIPVTVLNSDGVGAAFYVAQGIYHAIAQGADVINLSLVSIRDSIAVSEAIEAAQQSGATVVAAVGNTARQNPAPYPAAGNVAIAVAATNAHDIKAPFSDFGSFVDLCAPGVELISAFPGGGYARASGASLSAALVSGTAALLRSAHPPATTQQVRDAIIGSAVSIDHLNPDHAGLLGSGRLRPAAAVLAITGRPLCDFDGDQKIDSTDIARFVAAWLAQRPSADVNGDGKLDSSDFSDFLTKWLKCYR